MLMLIKRAAAIRLISSLMLLPHASYAASPLLLFAASPLSAIAYYSATLFAIDAAFRRFRHTHALIYGAMSPDADFHAHCCRHADA